MVAARLLLLVLVAASLAASLCLRAAADPLPEAGPAAASGALDDDGTLTLLTVDVRTLPAPLTPGPATPVPQWRTSFGSERRSEPARTKPSTGVDADIVLLQGVTDVPALRRWFPAGQWRLIASRQLLAGRQETDAAAPPAPLAAPVPSTAVAVRLRRGLRITGQDHLLELSDALGQGPAAVTAAATAVRVAIANRATWAVSVLLPEDCAAGCPGRVALERWHAERAAENIRRATGGRFMPGRGTSTADATACATFGLRLDPPPPPPRPAFTPAARSSELGCAAAVSVAK